MRLRGGIGCLRLMLSQGRAYEGTGARWILDAASVTLALSKQVGAESERVCPGLWQEAVQTVSAGHPGKTREVQMHSAHDQVVTQHKVEYRLT
jgi:hypothetical protein